jgi:hypothetical protein
MTLELELFPFDSGSLTYGAAVKKTFEQWGIAQDAVQGAFREQTADELTLSFPGRALLAAQFPYRSKVKVTIDAAPFFSGYVVNDPSREGDGFTNRHGVAVAGPWWFLEGLPFRQAQQRLTGIDGSGNPVYSTSYLTQFTLNLPLTPNFQNIFFPSIYYTSTLLDSRAQLKAVLDYAIAKGAWVQYVEAELMQVKVLPADVLNITCAEAIRRQIEDVDAVAWFDHTVSPPKFCCKRRVDLPAYSRALGNAREVQGFNLKRRDDLSVPYVQINFDQPYNVGGINTVTQVQDLYPTPKPADEFRALITTVPLRGISGTRHEKYIRTESIAVDSLDWWKRRKPELDGDVNPNAASDYASLALLAGTENRALKSGTANLPNMIVDGGYADFMGGDIGDEQVTVQAKYHRRFDANRRGTKISAHTFRARCRTTSLDFPAGVNFIYNEFSSVGEDVSQFIGIAQTIYEDLNAPQWEGAVPLFELEYSGEIKLGKNLNLTNGRGEWANMNALAREVGFRIVPGGLFYTVSVGPNKKLTAAQLADRLRAARTRYVTAINLGPLGGGVAVQHTRHHASDAGSSAEPVNSEIFATEENAGKTLAGQAYLAGNGAAPVLGFNVVKPDGTIDSTKPRVRFSAADIINGRAL